MTPFKMATLKTFVTFICLICVMSDFMSFGSACNVPRRFFRIGKSAGNGTVKVTNVLTPIQLNRKSHIVIENSPGLGGRKLGSESMFYFSVAQQGSREEVESAILHLNRKRMPALYPGSSSRPRYLPIPYRIALYHVIPRTRRRPRKIGSIPVSHLNRGGWHSFDITTMIREMFARCRSPSCEHLLGIRFEAPRMGRRGPPATIPLKRFLRCSGCLRRASYLVFMSRRYPQPSTDAVEAPEEETQQPTASTSTSQETTDPPQEPTSSQAPVPVVPEAPTPSSSFVGPPGRGPVEYRYRMYKRPMEWDAKRENEVFKHTNFPTGPRHSRPILINSTGQAAEVWKKMEEEKKEAAEAKRLEEEKKKKEEERLASEKAANQKFIPYLHMGEVDNVRKGVRKFEKSSRGSPPMTTI